MAIQRIGNLEAERVSRAEAGATSYDVYLSTASTPAFLKNVTTASTTAGPLTAGTVYYWNVVAKNACGSSASSPSESMVRRMNRCASWMSLAISLAV